MGGGGQRELVPAGAGPWAVRAAGCCNNEPAFLLRQGQ